jgi:hypothetical protein
MLLSMVFVLANELELATFPPISSDLKTSQIWLAVFWIIGVLRSHAGIVDLAFVGWLDLAFLHRMLLRPSYSSPAKQKKKTGARIWGETS